MRTPQSISAGRFKITRDLARPVRPRAQPARRAHSARAAMSTRKKLTFSARFRAIWGINPASRGGSKYPGRFKRGAEMNRESLISALTVWRRGRAEASRRTSFNTNFTALQLQLPIQSHVQPSSRPGSMCAIHPWNNETPGLVPRVGGALVSLSITARILQLPVILDFALE